MTSNEEEEGTLAYKIRHGELHKTSDTNIWANIAAAVAAASAAASEPDTPIQKELKSIYSTRPTSHHQYSAQWVLYGQYDEYMGKRIGTQNLSAVYFDFIHMIRTKLAPHSSFWNQFITDEQNIDVYCMQDMAKPTVAALSTMRPKLFITGTATHAISVYVTYTDDGDEEWKVFDSNGAIHDFLRNFADGTMSPDEVAFVMMRNPTQRFVTLNRLLEFYTNKDIDQEEFYPLIGAAPMYVVTDSGRGLARLLTVDEETDLRKLRSVAIDPTVGDQIVTFRDKEDLKTYVRLIKEDGTGRWRAYTMFNMRGRHQAYYPVSQGSYNDILTRYHKRNYTEHNPPLEEIFVPGGDSFNCVGTVVVDTRTFWLYRQSRTRSYDPTIYAVTYESYEPVYDVKHPVKPISVVDNQTYRETSRLQQSGSCAYYAQYQYFRYRILTTGTSQRLHEFDRALDETQRTNLANHRVEVERQLSEHSIDPHMVDLFRVVDFIRTPGASKDLLIKPERDEYSGLASSRRNFSNVTSVGDDALVVFPLSYDERLKHELPRPSSEYQQLTDYLVQMFGHIDNLNEGNTSVDAVMDWAQHSVDRRNKSPQVAIVKLLELMLTLRDVANRLPQSAPEETKTAADYKALSLYQFLNKFIAPGLRQMWLFKFRWLETWTRLMEESILRENLPGLYFFEGRPNPYHTEFELQFGYDQDGWKPVVNTREFRSLLSVIERLLSSISVRKNEYIAPLEVPAHIKTPVRIVATIQHAVEMDFRFEQITEQHLNEFEKENSLAMGVRKHPIIWPKYDATTGLQDIQFKAARYFVSAALEFATFDTNAISTQGGYWTGGMIVSLSSSHPFGVRGELERVELYKQNLPYFGFCNYLQLWLHILEPETFGAITPRWNKDHSSLTSCTWNDQSIPVHFDVRLYPEILPVLSDRHVRIDIYEKISLHPHIRFYISLYPGSKLAILDRTYLNLRIFMAATRLYTNLTFTDKEGNALVTTKLSSSTNLPPFRFKVSGGAIVSEDETHTAEVRIAKIYSSCRKPAENISDVVSRVVSSSNGMYYFLQVRCAHNRDQFLALRYNYRSKEWFFNDYRIRFQRPKSHPYAMYWHDLPDTYLLESPETGEIRGMLVIDNIFNTPSHNNLYGNLPSRFGMPSDDAISDATYEYTVIFLNPQTVVNGVLHFQSFEECDVYMREIARGCRYDLFVRMYPQWRSWRNTMHGRKISLDEYAHGPFRRLIRQALNDEEVKQEEDKGDGWAFDQWDVLPVPDYIFKPFKYTQDLGDEAAVAAATFESCQALFQYSFPFPLRETQVQVCQEIISQNQKRYFIRQLVMGAGKSTVIIPLVTMYHAYKTNDRETIQIVIAPTAVIARQLVTSLINGLTPYGRFTIHTARSIPKPFEPSVSRQDMVVLVMTDMEAKQIFLGHRSKFPWNAAFTIIDEVDTVMNPYTSTFLLQQSKDTRPVFTDEEIDFFFEHMLELFVKHTDTALDEASLVRDIYNEYYAHAMATVGYTDAAAIIWLYALSAVVKMRYMYQYGFVEDIILAIPYTGFEHPARSSKFTDPAIQLWTTIIGICHERRFMSNQIRSMYEYCHNMRKLNPRFEIPAEWEKAGVNPSELPVTHRNLHLMVKYVLMALVNQAHSVAQTNSVEMIHPRYGLVTHGGRYAGVSGTIDPRLFPFPNDTEIHPDPETVGLITAVLDNDGLYFPVPDLRNFISVVTNQDSDGVRHVAFMDVCGVTTLLGDTTTAIVEEIFRLAGNDSVRVLYISVHDNELPYVYDGTSHQRFDERLSPDRHKYVYFYDQAHCVGVNINQRYGKNEILPVSGAVFLANNDFAIYSKAAQAAFRLRHLTEGQRVFFMTVGGAEGQPVINSAALKARENRLMESVAAKIEEQVQRSESPTAHDPAMPAIWYREFYGDTPTFDKYLHAALAIGNEQQQQQRQVEISTEHEQEEEEEEEEEEEQEQEQEQEQEHELIEVQTSRRYNEASVFGVYLIDKSFSGYQEVYTPQQKPYTLAFTVNWDEKRGIRLEISAQTNHKLNDPKDAQPNQRWAGCVDGLSDFMHHLYIKDAESPPDHAWQANVYCVATLLYNMLYRFDAYRLVNVIHALQETYSEAKFKEDLGRLKEILSMFLWPTETRKALQDIENGQFGGDQDVDLRLSQYLQQHLQMI